MPGLRKFVGSGKFVVGIGPITITGCLIPVVATGANEFKEYVVICPDCADPTRPTQGYTCEQGHGPYPLAALHRARSTDEGLVRVSMEDYASARQSDLPLNYCRISVHPAEQVANLTRPSGQGYAFFPDVESREFNLILAMVENSEKALLSAINLRHNEGLYQLTLWNGNLVLQRMLWPNELAVFDARTTNIDTAHRNAATGMLERITEEFDPEQYLSTTRIKLERLNASLDGSDMPVRVRTETRDDLLEVLNAFG